MARPSLPAAIAPFQGCPAGCLRVACETLLSPSAQKGRMNNGPRQALALNNPFLCLTFSFRESNHMLFPQNPHSFIHQKRFLQLEPFSPHCFPRLSEQKLSNRFPIQLTLTELFSCSFSIDVTLRDGKHKASQVGPSSQDLVWPSSSA